MNNFFIFLKIISLDVLTVDVVDDDLVVDMAAGTANGNTYTHTAMELTQRVTKIPLDGIAECTLTFEANSAGAWDSPA